MELEIVKLFEQFPKEDNEYREHLIRNFGCKWSSDTKFSLLFCGHEDLIRPNSTTKLSDNPFQQFKHLCDDRISLPVRKVPRGLLNVNIKRINKAQENILQEKGGSISYNNCPDQEDGFNKWTNVVDVGTDVGENRSLVLYFRRETLEQADGHMCHTAQMDYFQFCAIAYVLSRYIHEQKSYVFNKLKIVSREPFIYPKYVHKLCNIEYANVEGIDFIRETCLGANTMHFLHGTAPDNACGTIPIYCNSMLLDENRADDDCVQLHLNYNMKNDDDPVMHRGKYVSIKKAFEDQYGKTMYTLTYILNSALSAVIKLENKLLKG
jgi:hypothetical protein